MENVQVATICKIRDLYRSIAEFEASFQDQYDLCLNEGVLLCTLGDQKYSSSEIAESLGLTNSNTSKVIKSVENKGLVKRNIGKEDKRQMYFALTKSGQQLLSKLKCADLNLPTALQDVIN